MIYNRALNAIRLNYYKKVCNSCAIYTVLVIIIISISSAFIYIHWYFKNDNIHEKFNTNTQTTIH